MMYKYFIVGIEPLDPEKEKTMKKRLLVLAIMILALSCLLAISVSAEDKIIKLDTLPTLEEIHANPSAYVSRIDAFETGETYAKYREADSNSVVVLSDLAETPTYYVYPAYYYVPNTTLQYYSHMSTFNSAISAADSTAFAGYSAIDNNYGNGASKYLIRIEMPTYLTTIAARAKFENSSNLVEIYLPVKKVIDEETGLEKTVTCITSISGSNLFSSCSKLEVIHNMQYAPKGLVQGNDTGFSGCAALKEFIIPEGVTSIPNYFFKNCESLTELILPNTVTTVGKQAFAHCYDLERISFGAGFTTFSSPNRDYETFSSSNALEFVYLPATFANVVTATANQFQNIFSSGSAKTIYFVTESDYDKVVTIRDNFKATNANGNIGNVETIELYDPNKDYEAYQATLTKSVIVYGLNVCDTFYDGAHNYTGDGDCTHGATCTQCEDKLVGFDSHVFKETLVYENGFAQSGVYNKVCTNLATCTCQNITEGDATIAAPIFEARAENGYSTNGEGIAFGGYTVNVSALNTFNTINGTTPLHFGIIVVNPKYLGDTFMNGGKVNATAGELLVEMDDVQYSDIKIMLDGFTGKAAELELVISLYAYTDTSDVEFIQSEHTACAESKVTKGDATLYTITLNSVENKPCTSLDALPEYKKDEE